MDAVLMEHTMDTLTILVGQQLDGHTFMLEPKGMTLLQGRYPGAHIVKKVFISHDTRLDFEAIHGTILHQVISLLVGMSPERIADDGIAVAFRDVANDKIISYPTTHAA